jgi:uncharacterized membrane protein
MKGFLKKYLSDADLNTIAAKIGEAESETSGQIRVSIRQRRHWREWKLSLHQIALIEFQRMGMQRTTHRTGVLILLLMSEKKFHVIADEGIHKKVPDGTWDAVATLMAGHFKKGNFLNGICEGIDMVGDILTTYFPKQSGDGDELPQNVEVSR